MRSNIGDVSSISNLALGWMVQHEIPPTPSMYELWFNYFSSNSVRQSVEDLISSQGKSIDEIDVGLCEYVYNILFNIDSLTKLGDKKSFDLVMQRAISQSDQTDPPLSLLLIDIDDFKSINDRFGHLAGDSVLRDVATLFLNKTRGQDFVFRFGGEEFGVVAFETDLKGAVKLGELLRDSVSKTPVQLKESSILRVTISIGVVQYIQGWYPNDFIRNADKALYHSKKCGKNCSSIFKDGETKLIMPNHNQ